MGLTVAFLQTSMLRFGERPFLLLLLGLYGPRVALHDQESHALLCLLCT